MAWEGLPKTKITLDLISSAMGFQHKRVLSNKSHNVSVREHNIYQASLGKVFGPSEMNKFSF